MKVFFALNAKNVGMLYQEFKSMAEEAKKMKLFLVGFNGRRELLMPTVGYRAEDDMQIYLAGKNSKGQIIKGQIMTQSLKKRQERDTMKVCLSGTGCWKYAADHSDAFTIDNAKSLYVLESFAYINADDILIPLIPYFKDFMLDSGAFTFLSQKKNGDFNKYLKSYIDFVNKHDIQKFFELDIDAIVGYKKVLEYRKILEAETGKKVFLYGTIHEG